MCVDVTVVVSGYGKCGSSSFVNCDLLFDNKNR